MSLPQALIDRAASDQAALDAQLAAGGKQADVLTAEGQYLQIVCGMAQVPEDGNAEPVDATAKPSDRPTSPADWGIARQTSSTICTTVDEYDSPEGRGWGYRQEVVVSGVRWARIEWRVNPASRTDFDWTGGP